MAPRTRNHRGRTGTPTHPPATRHRGGPPQLYDRWLHPNPTLHPTQAGNTTTDTTTRVTYMVTTHGSTRGTHLVHRHVARGHSRSHRRHLQRRHSRGATHTLSTAHGDGARQGIRPRGRELPSGNGVQRRSSHSADGSSRVRQSMRRRERVPQPQLAVAARRRNQARRGAEHDAGHRMPQRGHHRPWLHRQRRGDLTCGCVGVIHLVASDEALGVRLKGGRRLHRQLLGEVQPPSQVPHHHAALAAAGSHHVLQLRHVRQAARHTRRAGEPRNHGAVHGGDEGKRPPVQEGRHHHVAVGDGHEVGDGRHTIHGVTHGSSFRLLLRILAVHTAIVATCVGLERSTQAGEHVTPRARLPRCGCMEVSQGSQGHTQRQPRRHRRAVRVDETQRAVHGGGVDAQQAACSRSGGSRCGLGTRTLQQAHGREPAKDAGARPLCLAQSSSRRVVGCSPCGRRKLVAGHGGGHWVSGGTAAGASKVHESGRHASRAVGGAVGCRRPQDLHRGAQTEGGGIPQLQLPVGEEHTQCVAVPYHLPDTNGSVGTRHATGVTWYSTRTIATATATGRDTGAVGRRRQASSPGVSGAGQRGGWRWTTQCGYNVNPSDSDVAHARQRIAHGHQARLCWGASNTHVAHCCCVSGCTQPHSHTATQPHTRTRLHMQAHADACMAPERTLFVTLVSDKPRLTRAMAAAAAAAVTGKRDSGFVSGADLIALATAGPVVSTRSPLVTADPPRRVTVL